MRNIHINTRTVKFRLCVEDDIRDRNDTRQTFAYLSAYDPFQTELFYVGGSSVTLDSEVTSEENRAFTMVCLRDNDEFSLTENALCSNDGIKRSESCVITIYCVVRNTQIDEFFSHFLRFIVIFSAVVSRK